MLAEQPQGHVTTPIMPARPLCYGSVADYTPCILCSYYRYCAVMSIELLCEIDALRVYARENHELRERVEALEWLREVEDAKDAIYWAYNSSEDSWDEYIEIHSCARRTAGLHPLESKKITLGAMGLKEAGV